MPKKVRFPRWFRITLKTVFWSVVSVILLLAITLGLLQLPSVQNYITQKGLAWASDKTNHQFEVDGIRIAWFDELEISGFKLEDYRDSVLVEVGTLKLDYDLWRLVKTKKLELQSVELSGGLLRLVDYQDSLDLNLIVFLNSLENLSEKKEEVDTTSTEQSPIYLGSFQMNEFSVSLDNENFEHETEKLDANHLNFRISEFEVEDISVKQDSISLSIIQLAGADHANGLFLEEFKTRFGFTDKGIILDDLTIRTPETYIGDSIAFSFNNPSALGSFSDSVSFYVNLKECTIGKSDFKALTGNEILRQNVDFNLTLSGKLSDLRIRDTDFRMGRSLIKMDASIIGLPQVEETFIDFNLDRSRVYTSDIKHLVGKDGSDLFTDISWVDVSATFSGFLNDFSTKGSVKTNFGGLSADMNITVPDDVESTAYSGHIQLHNLDVGRLIGDTSLVQNVSLKGRVLGKGITLDKASFLTELTGHDIGIKHYVYDTVSFKGYLAAKRFFGQFRIDDPNCKISGKTDVDVRTIPEKLSLTARIDTIRTRDLNLTEQDIALSTYIKWNQKHLNPDSLTGSLFINDTEFSMDTSSLLSLSSMEFETDLDSTHRSVDVRLPGIVLDMDGEFTFSQLGQFLQHEVSELTDYFDLDTTQLEVPVPAMNAQILGYLNDLSPYTQFFSPSVTISDSSIFKVFLEKKDQSDGIISVYAMVDSVVFNDDLFLENEVDLYASMDPNSNGILGSFSLTSKDQNWKAVPRTRDFRVEGVWLDDEIEVTTMIEQPETDTRAFLEAGVVLSGDSIEFKFKPSELMALGRTWSFDPANYINVSKKGLLFRSLDLISDDKRASLNGLLSESESSSVNFVAKNIDLHQINYVFNIPVEGIFGADFSVYRLPNQPVQFEGEFDLRDFIYKDITIGDIHGKAAYDLDNEGIKTNLSVARENFKTISVDGYYYSERAEQLDFLLSFDQADFKMLEVVTEGNLSDLQGKANGKIEIKGSTSTPMVTGYCELKETAFLVEYLKTRYEMGGRIVLKKDQIDLRNFILRDAKGDVATLKGSIHHKNFDDIVTDLQISASKNGFTFLNTTSRDNELYYGTANASGDIYVTGPFSDLILKVDAKTQRGTKFYIPLSDSRSFEQAEFMTFVDLSDTTRLQDEIIKQANSALGLTIDFDLEVTNDAYCELIFDIQTGDIIRGKGSGNLKLKMDKNGNFELFGALNIEEGGYNFTVPNFINKEFEVVPGSTITWYGDPYTGSMDLTAIYRQKAAFSGLDPNNDDGELQQKMPLIVKLELSGQMLTPTIGFDIALDESITPSQNITRLMNQVKSDEQQLKRQVVSLMFLKRFSPLQDSFVGGGGGGVSIGKSLSEFLTNQISYLASQIDENLEVEVDLSNMDQDAFKTFQLRLAYTFMDGRLKVSRGGDFNSATADENNLVNDIIGDWSVEYMLTKDGKLRAKMFSRSNQNQVAADGQQSMETGLSLKFVTSFNRFSEILTRARSDAMQRKEDEIEEEGGTE